MGKARTFLSRSECLSELGLGESASAVEIRRAYRRLVLRVHPDRAGDSAEAKAAFYSVTEAYRRLRELDHHKSATDHYARDAFGSGVPPANIEEFRPAGTHPAASADSVHPHAAPHRSGHRRRRVGRFAAATGTVLAIASTATWMAWPPPPAPAPDAPSVEAVIAADAGAAPPISLRHPASGCLEADGLIPADLMPAHAATTRLDSLSRDGLVPVQTLTLPPPPSAVPGR